MSVKNRILDELGESRLVLPGILNLGLEANDRVKVVFSLLQAARQHADRPDAAPADLRLECEGVGLTDPALDAVVRDARRLERERYAIPAAGRLLELIRGAMEQMLRPLQASGAEEDAVRAADYERRLQALLDEMPSGEGGVLPGAWISAATRGRSSAGDSLHVLVMDLHQELNRLQGEVAAESVDGAQAYGLDEDDRRLVRAFMAGLASTAWLKFDHPGLATTATRVGSRLVLQNDIGTTDAHVLVVHVEDRTVTVTYTDVHPQRAEFFRSLLEPCGLRWHDTLMKHDERFEDGAYVLSVGRFEAQDDEELERALSHVGSRLVFLIDWNRARKQLRPLIGKRDAVALLKESADANHGHRAFLQLGGARLVQDALQRASPTPLPYGRRLDELIGREAARDYLRFVLRRTCAALSEGRSERLVADELRAELLPLFHTAGQELLDEAARHAELTFEIATQVRDLLVEASLGAPAERLQELTARAVRWEHEADSLVRRVREDRTALAEREAPLMLVNASEDTADQLEEVAHLATMLPIVGDWSAFADGLIGLADLSLAGSRDLVSGVAAALHVHRGGEREDLQDALEAVDRIVLSEHRSDVARRELTARLVADSADHRQLHLLSRIADGLEASSNELAHAAHLLRELVLGDLVQR